jgi:hypothetical protein
MKAIIQLEELCIFIACIVIFHLIPIPNKWFWILLFVPDVSMIGYILGNKVGACIYNIFHHRGIAALLALVGWYIANDWIIASGIILFAHSTFDRMLGYGLKHFEGFKFTHLGIIGKKQ